MSSSELEAARQLLQKDEEEKLQAFWDEIAAVCEKHGYQISPLVQLRAVRVE